MSQVANESRTVQMPGEITPLTLSTFEREIETALADKPYQMCVECQPLRQIYSGHVNLLWCAHTKCLERGVKLRLVHPSIDLLRVLRVLDLVELFGDEVSGGRTRELQDTDRVVIDSPRCYTDTVSAGVAEIDEAIARFAGFLTSLGAGATTQLEIRTIYYEIATNIRIHSGISASDSFSLRAEADSDHLTLIFIDSGEPFDPAAGVSVLDAVAASHHRRKRGFGLSMIHQIADSIAYHRDEAGQNNLTITKKWHC